MSWSWRIQRSAVEQEILFPSVEVYEDYIDRFEEVGTPYEIVREDMREDGTVVAVMRKPYNNTKFLKREYDVPEEVLEAMFHKVFEAEMKEVVEKLGDKSCAS